MHKGNKLMKLKILILNLSLGTRKTVNKNSLVNHIVKLLSNIKPDIVLAQEAARALPLNQHIRSQLLDLSKVTSRYPKDYLGIIADRLRSDYELIFSPSILQHPDKRKRTGVNPDEVWGQGNCIIISQKLITETLDFWEGNNLVYPIVEELYLPRQKDNYIYLGSRSSEPRIVQLLRLKLNKKQFVFVNIHLTTLRGERSGYSKIDQQAQYLRKEQISEIIHTYKVVKEHSNKLTKKKSDDITFFLGGDFNELRKKLNDHSGLLTQFKMLIDGSTRPGGRYSVDNAFIDIAHESMVAGIKIFETDDQSSYNDLLLTMIDNGMDHWPILVELDI